MITYSAIFMTADAKPQKNGVVTIDVSTDQLKKIIRDLDVARERRHRPKQHHHRQALVAGPHAGAGHRLVHCR